MNKLTKHQALSDLANHMETFLENFPGVDFPYMPPGLALLMAEAALGVIEILAVDQEALREDGILKEQICD